MIEDIFYQGERIKPDRETTSGILWVGEDENGNPKENYLKFSDVSADVKPVPKMPKDFTGFVQIKGEDK